MMGLGARLRCLATLLMWGALLILAVRRSHHAKQHGRPALPAQLLLLYKAVATCQAENNLPMSLLNLTADNLVLSAEQRAEAERQLPSLPLNYWFKHKNDENKFFKKKDCAPFPSIYKLEFHNIYWQTMHTKGSRAIYLYGAYLDVRKASRIGPAVRILAVYDRIKPKVRTHCQLWFEGRSAPVIVKNREYTYVWYKKWGNYRDGVLQPYLLACVLPPDVRDLVPASVSLVVNPCDSATNNLRVHYNLPKHNKRAKRKEFAVCVKGLDFLHKDISVRLVEWIELIHLLGADKIVFYQLHVHPNITKVLQYYKERGIVSVTPITLPGSQPNLPRLQHSYLLSNIYHKRQMEMIPYNDCLYRHMYKYRWLTLLDIDEVIVPLEDLDWSGLMKRALRLSRSSLGTSILAISSYYASNIFYLDFLQHDHKWDKGIPRYMHMLQHVYRTLNFTKPGNSVKAFHETDRVLTLHNHYALSCLGGKCMSFPLPTDLARLHHYRAGCMRKLSKTCVKLRKTQVRDTELWRWRKPLVYRVETALLSLGFLTRHNAAIYHVRGR